MGHLLLAIPQVSRKLGLYKARLELLEVHSKSPEQIIEYKRRVESDQKQKTARMTGKHTVANLGERVEERRSREESGCGMGWKIIVISA